MNGNFPVAYVLDQGIYQVFAMEVQDTSSGT